MPQPCPNVIVKSVGAMLLAHDFVASRAELVAGGCSPRDLARAVHLGEAHRPRRGWYAHPAASGDLIRAIRVGGRMACLTAARSYGLWTIDDGRTHVHVPESASRLRSRDDERRLLGDRKADNTCFHREVVAAVTRPTRLRVSLVEVLAEVVCHGNGESSMVALDSAANRGLLPGPERALLREKLPAKYRALIDDIRPESESGLETLVRRRLLGCGIVPALQVTVADGIRVDLLVGERLIIETDGREFHSDSVTFEADRGRDLFLKAFGYEVLRLSYRQVMGDWPSCEATVVRMLARGRHLWRS